MVEIDHQVRTKMVALRKSNNTIDSISEDTGICTPYVRCILQEELKDEYDKYNYLCRLEFWWNAASARFSGEPTIGTSLLYYYLLMYITLCIFFILFWFLSCLASGFGVGKTHPALAEHDLPSDPTLGQTRFA